MNQDVDIPKATSGEKGSQPTTPADQVLPQVPTWGHPDDVLSHPKMTKAEKQAILASWASDARTVENAPALRHLDGGAIVSIDEIMQAMKALDQVESAPPRQELRIPGCRVSFARARKTLAWLQSKSARRSSGDDEDDPPPCPAVAALPARRSLVAAHGERRPLASAAA